jgi:hypothetical protein
MKLTEVQSQLLSPEGTQTQIMVDEMSASPSGMTGSMSIQIIYMGPHVAYTNLTCH